jgi:hypothetical protein
MAEYFGLGADEPTEQSELVVAKSLKQLPDPWVVLHHVSWQAPRNGREGDGEADFVLIHPQHGCIVLEIKGGGISLDKGRWTTTDRFGHIHFIKNPYEQAIASKHALVNWLSRFSFAGRIRIGHAVAFPHHVEMPQLGPYAGPAITITRSHLSQIGAAVMRCVKHWQLSATLSPQEFGQLVNLLAPTREIRRSLSIESSDADARILTLTAEQVAAFAGLQASRGGLLVGPAGSGKTVLAIARAQKLARDGFATALLCFNELLAEQMSGGLADIPTISAMTFHSLCLKSMRRAGLPIPSYKSPEWWADEAPDLLVKATEISGKIYEAIVIDEGQDFSPLWTAALHMVLRESEIAPFYVFADPRQDIWKRSWAQDTSYPFVWELTTNLRNTEPIARKVCQTIGEPCFSVGTHGPNPVWKEPATRTPSESDVLEVLERLADEGFHPSKVVVITMGSDLCTRLRERTTARHSLGAWGSRGFAVETLQRFKGLESEAVVLVLDRPDTEDIDLRGYVGMSRARALLVVIGSKELQPRLHW